MQFLGLRNRLTTPLDQTSRRSTSIAIVGWLALSLGFAIYYGSLGLQKAFRADYVVQDDAREYVFWMQQFVNPALFPQDLIADYFHSITPAGYAAIYHLAARVGIEPLLLSKVLPIVLGVLTTLYGFGVCLQLLPVPASGFIAMVLLNQSLWFRDDLSSATPRAFIYLLFLAFLYYLLRSVKLGVVITIVLQALIYPPLVFITIGILLLRLLQQRAQPRFGQKQILWFSVTAGLAILALLPYVLSSGEFNPIVTKAEALTMPEFYPGGRHPYFDSNLWRFWLTGQHSGILPPLLPPLIWSGLALPILFRSSRFPLIKHISGEVSVLTQAALVSLGLFLTAHAVLLRLFFPTRYTAHTWRIVLAIASGIVLTILLDAMLLACADLMRSHRWKSVFWRLSLTIVVGIVLILFPMVARDFPATNYRVSGEGALYQFLQQQPQDSLVATLSDEANNIPTFAQRSVLVGKEYALPFHLGFYRQIRQRSIELIQAQYSQDLASVQQVIRKYGVDVWLLDRAAFMPQYLPNKTWLQSFQPAFDQAVTTLQQGKVPALTTRIKDCSVFQSESVIVLKADCI